MPTCTGTWDSSGIPCGRNNCNHYALIVDNIIINDVDSDYNRFIINHIKSNDLRFIYSRGYWNDLYNHYNNTKVRKSINYFFKNETKEKN